jgi:replicative DNA helicase
MRAGNIPEAYWGEIMRVVDRLSSVPIYVEDPGSLTVNQFRTRVRRLVTQRKVKLLIVDYLQLMQGTRTENRVQEVSEISRVLKSVARDYDIPVIALSQLSRALEARPNKRPVLSDLRDSGGLEQDADIVMMLYREHVYNKQAKEHEAELNIVKHRNGPLSEITLHFDARLTTFGNWTFRTEEVAI